MAGMTSTRPTHGQLASGHSPVLATIVITTKLFFTWRIPVAGYAAQGISIFLHANLLLQSG